MMWIGLVVGVVVGGLVWGMEGAVTLGFIGWLAGVIIKSSQKAQLPAVTVQTPTAAQRPSTESWTIEDRVARLEATVARLEAQLGTAPVVPHVAPVEAPVIPDAAPIVVPDAAPAAMIRDPMGSPTIAAEAASGMTPEPPPPPRPPNPIVAWFSGVNAIARVGLVILFFGLAFLLKYAAEAQMLPPELRVGGVAAGAIAMLVLGWRLRTRREGFALGLQGAGIAVLYLTTFAALRLYHLIPPELAFFILAGIAIFSAALAVMQNAVALAVIGAGGGFLAPVLASTGAGSHVMLFSYFLILNLGIAAIAYFRAWRPLNLTGFLFTFLIGLAWGMRSYRPEHFDTTEPFLIAFWVIYVAIAILVARPKLGSDQGQSGVRAGSDPGFRRYVDGTLVFGVPLAAFGLQAGLMRDTEYGLAFSSLAAAALYIALAAGLLRATSESWRLLAQAFIALGVVFATLAIPLALDARWTSASWALEGAAIVWIGIRQQRKIARAFGILLQLAAGVAYIEGYRRLPGGYPLVDAAFIGAMLVALAGLWTNRLILGAGEAVTKTERSMATPIFAWGLAWLIFAGADEIRTHLEPRMAFNAQIAFLAATAALFGWLAVRWSWGAAAWTARALLPALFALACVMLVDDRHPFGRLGWFAWPLAIAVHAWILRTVDPERRSPYTTFLHAGGMVLVAFVGAQELHWLAQTYTAHHAAWSAAALAVAPALVVWIASMHAFDYRWPIDDHPRAYRRNAPIVIGVALGIWSLVANVTHDARSDPLPYIPILNAVDLAHLFTIFSLASAWLAARRSGLEPPVSLRGSGALVVTGALGFVWLNAILLRTLSHWADIPYTPSVLMRSILVQSALSIFWTVLALAAMVYATRTVRRPLWMVGVVLLGIVVAKLFLFDLANAGRIEQIVSFIAVGLLILVVGYFSPLPPRKLDSPSPLGEEEGKPEVAS